MPWSQRVLSQFVQIPPNPNENEFHGAYNKLLNTLFPPDTEFVVIPQYLQIGCTQVVDFLVTYEVFLRNRPVFVLELKASRELAHISTRRNADDQMRDRLTDLRGTCPIPTLYGVSAMGTRLCFYRVPSGNHDAVIHPPVIPRHPTLVTDVAPADRWDCDILEPEGEARFRAVVNEILQACAGLNQQ